MGAAEIEFADQVVGTFTVLLVAYTSLLASWPLFLWLEKKAPVRPGIPRSNYAFNWKITASNLLLAPVFSASVVLFTVYVSSIVGLPTLDLSPPSISTGIALLDIILQGVIIFFTACLIGDFWYYWWHRMQHKLPFLWEMHKLHHSDEHLNATTIYRSHFLESAGQALVRGLSIGLVFDVTKAPESALTVVAGGLMLALWDYFIHANVRIDALHRLTPWFSNPQYHWIHHSSLPQHQDKNFAIWLPLYDRIFGSYYQGDLDEYPPTGLSSGEQITTVWDAQAGPLISWGRSLLGVVAAKKTAAKQERFL
jgi:sterol desaturase/sphingolipid hydroxylase (fatty acid hydroxylase superfamily)